MRRYSGVISVVLLLAVAVGFITRQWLICKHEKAAVARTFDSLNMHHSLRYAALEDFFGSVESDVRSSADSLTLQSVYRELRAGWQELDTPEETLVDLYITKNPNLPPKRAAHIDAKDGSRYSRAHANSQPWGRRFLKHFGFYDVFLIDEQGNVIYSVTKESDFATNVKSGVYAQSALGRAFRSAFNRKDGKTAFTDFEPYAPSNSEPAAFAAYALRGEQGKAIGVFAIQIPMEPIRDLLAVKQSMGETGETYLVGADHLMRSQSRFIETSTILKQQVNSWPLRRAMAGQSGTQLATGYRGVSVLSAYAPFDIGGTRWALLAEMDEAEAIGSFDRSRLNIWALLAALTVLTFGWMFGGFYGMRLKRGWGKELSFAEIRRVENSWNKIIAYSDEFGVCLYEHLLEREPEVATLFSLPPDKQGPLFTQMLGAAVTRLQSQSEAQSMLRELGRRHVGYGVKEAYFSSFKEALMLALEEVLKRDFTPAISRSWSRAYDVITESMIEGLADGRRHAGS